MAVRAKRIPRSKPLDTSYGYKYREVIGGKLTEQGRDFEEVSSAEQNRAYQLISLDNQRDALKVGFDKIRKPLEERKKARTPAEHKQFLKLSNEFNRANARLDAVERDIERSRYFGTFRSAFQSFAQGYEMLKAPYRIIAEGEDSAMAYQEASQLLAYHVPDGAIDKYLNLIAANAIPMGATIAAHFIPVIGPALGMGLAGSYMGANLGLELRRKGVSKEQALFTGIVGGIALGTVEFAVGPVLSKVPGLGRVFGHASRVNRFRALKSLVGAKGDLTALYAKSTIKNVNFLPIQKALQAVFGTSTNQAQVLIGLARQGASEALTGGVEEWIQEGIELALSEQTLKDAGLEGVLPRYSDGTINGKAILSQMNEAFVAGFFLEGLIGGGMAAQGIGSRFQMADRMGALVNMLGGEFINTGKEGFELPGKNLSPDTRLFIAQKMYMDLIVKEKAFKEKKGRDYTPKERRFMLNRSKMNAISLLQNNPIRSLFINFADSQIESVIPGEMAVIKRGDKTIAIVKSSGLPGDAGAQYVQNPDGSEQIGVTEEVWNKLEELGLKEDVIAVNMFQGSMLGHELMHEVLRNLPEGQVESVLNLWEITESEFTDKSEKTPAEYEELMQERAAKEYEEYSGNPFKDAYARLLVAAKGKGASKWAQKSVIFQSVEQTIKIGKTPDLSGLQAEDRIMGFGRAGIAMARNAAANVIGVTAGVTGASKAVEGPPSPATQAGERIRGFGMTVAEKAAGAAARIIKPKGPLSQPKTKVVFEAQRAEVSKRLTQLSLEVAEGDYDFAGEYWTSERRTQYQAVLDKVTKFYTSQLPESLTTDETKEVREYLESETFAPISDIITDVIAKQNAQVIEDVNAAELKVEEKIPSPEDQAADYARGITSAETSRRTVAKEIDEYHPVSGVEAIVDSTKITRFRLIGKLESKGINLMYPLTNESYDIMFGRILGKVFNNQDIKLNTKSDFESGIIYIGNSRFDLNVPSSLKVLNELTDIFGPMWAVATELNKYVTNNELQQVTEQLRSAYLDIVGRGKPKPKPNILRAVSAFITISNQADSLVDLGPGIGKQPLMTTADDIVAWFRDVAGLESDGSPVNFADLGQQFKPKDVEAINKLEAERQQITKALGDASGSTVYSIRTVFEAEVTAEAAAREFMRSFVEMFNPELTQQDLRQKTFQTQAGGQKLAGAAISPKNILRVGMSSKAKETRNMGPMPGFKTRDVQHEIGRILNEVTARMDQRGALFESEDVADQTIVEGIEELVTLQRAAVEAGVITEPAGPLTKEQRIEDLETLATAAHRISELDFNAKITDNALFKFVDSLMKYVQTDPGLIHIQRQLDKTQQLGPLSQAKTKIDPEQAYSLLKIQDRIFGERDLRNTKVQVDSLELMQKWNDIFGLETPIRFRDLMKDLAKTMTGIVTGKPILAELKTDRQRYEMAMIFALNHMNTAEPGKTADKVLKEIGDLINKLQNVGKRTVEQDYRLGKLLQYLDVQTEVNHILNSTGDYGFKINQYIHNSYKVTTDSYWNNFNLSAYKKAKYVGFYSPRVYVEGLLEHEGEYDFSQRTGRLIARQNEDLAPAMKKGLIFRFDNFLPALTSGMSQTINANANEDLIESGLQEGFFKTKAVDGYAMLEAKGAKKIIYEGTKFGAAKAMQFGTYDLAKEHAGQGGLVKAVPLDLYAPAEVAKYFNRITKSSSMRKNPYVLGLLATNAKLKGLKIVWGMFHRRAFIWSAMMAGTITPGMEFYTKEGGLDLSNLKAKLRDRFYYTDKRKLGLDLMMQGKREFYDLTYFGMTTFRIQDIGRASQQYKTMAEKWLAGESRGLPTKRLNSLVGKFSALTGRMQNELFGIFGSSLKAATAYNEYLRLINKHSQTIASEKMKSRDENKLSEQYEAYERLFPDTRLEERILTDYHSDIEVQILRAVAGMANADFGGLHTGRLGISKDSQDIMRLLFLGPDWTASNVISAMKLYKGKTTTESGVGTVFSGSAIEQEVYKQFWLRIIARSVVLATVINALMAGLDDESALQRLKKAKRRKGFKVFMADISPVIHMLGGDEGVDHYLNVPGHFLDIPKIATDPVRMFYHKSSSVAKPVIDLISGTRFDMKRPVKLTKIGRDGLYTWKSNRRGPLSPSEMPAWALYEMSQVFPIQLKNIFDVAMGEENAITGIMKAGLGLDVKRTYDKLNQRKF